MGQYSIWGWGGTGRYKGFSLLDDLEFQVTGGWVNVVMVVRQSQGRVGSTVTAMNYKWKACCNQKEENLGSEPGDFREIKSNRDQGTTKCLTLEELEY